MEADAHVLVVEDDRDTRDLVARALRDEGWRVTAVGRASAADAALADATVSAVVLDLLLPDGDGTALCRRWRSEGLRAPVLMLTAKTGVGSRVEGLDAGADDYMGKPFALAELKARVRALLRRGIRRDRDDVLEVAGLRIDVGRQAVTHRGRRLPLTRRELEVLARLARAGRRVVARATLLEDVWGETSEKSAASLEVIVARLRRKLAGGAADPIRTVRGVGYALDPSGTES